MTICKGLQLKVKTPKGFVDGIVSDSLELQGVQYWWIQFSDGDHNEFTIAEEKDLLDWNKSPAECDCGAKKLGHPGHVQWCSTNA